MTKPLLSIGMIVKNEARSLDKCLKALEPLRNALPCELIIADTGSTDATREIAQRYADLVFDFPWVNDFSAARNAVMDRASGKWYFTVDADEYLDPDISQLVEFLSLPRDKQNGFAAVVQRNYHTRDMAEDDYSGDYFVDMEKSDTGEITAVSSNMARINALSAKILHRVVGVTENRTIEIGIPAGNLTGISLLMGRGPNIPVQIVVLTSSRVEFNNSIVSAGINQTKHQINLEVIVDIDILVPWGTESAQVVTEVLIADTIVVGHVPDTYLNLQQ